MDGRRLEGDGIVVENIPTEENSVLESVIEADNLNGEEESKDEVYEEEHNTLDHIQLPVGVEHRGPHARRHSEDVPARYLKRSSRIPHRPLAAKTYTAT